MQSQNWVEKSIFYHIYPLGMLGAPSVNDFVKEPKPLLEDLLPWLNHIKEIGCNALYIGPLFESTSHGYDTVDYNEIDRRLGTNDTFKKLMRKAKELDIRVVLDGVFNHVGRDFFAFKDVQLNGKKSDYINWFSNLDFNRPSPLGDKFSYEGWNNHYNLVKLNLGCEEVKSYLFNAIQEWILDFGIDGLRLDAADSIEFEFFKELKKFCMKLRPNFWLMGEVVHGDYSRWANKLMLNSTTNYECYKGLYSSHNDLNYFEIAYSLNRQFGSEGIYKDLLLYNFVDNHDVDRVAIKLKKPEHLYPLYALLFTIPGIPSIYYGSEWGIEGKKRPHDDSPLRPHLTFQNLVSKVKHPELVKSIRRFAQIRKESQTLQNGDYKQLFIDHQQFAFSRSLGKETTIVLVNSSDEIATVQIPMPTKSDYIFKDLLDVESSICLKDGILKVEIPSNWVRILV
tara:strand:+ start:4016 stop:5374 length:1359 start_codon:yes stop_codon:yes gene_type:complete